MQGQPRYYKMLAKAIISNASGICTEIDRYLAKSDDDLKKTLKAEGYLEIGETVDAINSFEEDVADILCDQTDAVVETLQAAEKAGASWDDVKQRIEDLKEDDDTAERITDTAQEMYNTEVTSLANAYIKESDGELTVSTLRARTSNWISEWSSKLGELMNITSYDSLSSLIQDTISNGDSIAQLTQKILEGGWRSEYYQARSAAVTEVLRAHSVATEEGIQQSPACDRKEWRHTGAHKNNPRLNHVAMDHQIVAKDEPFEMQGRDGGTYYPMYPRDSSLPASESVNCHCIHRGIVNDDILGMSLEERQAMQQKIIDDDDGKWEKETDTKNKAKAGITPYNSLEEFAQKTRDEQVKSIGGKAKMALYDAGLIDSEDTLKKVKSSTLKELKEDGILTVKSSAVKHSTVGEFSSLRNPNAAAGGSNGGNMRSGGHSQANIDELTNRGISYSIEKTYDNGVRIGGVANHKDPSKRLGKSGQSWFPEGWDSEKISAAGTYTANRPAVTEELKDADGNITAYRKYQKYDGVTVGVIEDADHNIKTVFPDADQKEVGE